MRKSKQLFLLLSTICQLLGIVMLFINIKAAIFIFAIYAFLMIIIFIILIMERKNEKLEERRNDYRNY
ncbi:hypothetical protein [Cytobacillus dafuensis]|uniref:Uncharacterized protein n=1 Tax=Cytobacillus dafuensis TaxID=1742359 RepID=A0A5B8Z255_CYTDA|nr:hypothetical protein [Cytobacillus dafuensis]QED47104.1 hypothetical protein FSZ17_07505 [Cytobacillus dafuensis]